MEKIVLDFEMFCEQMLRRSTRDQMDRVNKQIKAELGGDIGSKTDKQNRTGAAYTKDYFDNPLDRFVDTYDDYYEEDFKSNQNVTQQPKSKKSKKSKK